MALYLFESVVSGYHIYKFGCQCVVTIVYYYTELKFSGVASSC